MTEVHQSFFLQEILLKWKCGLTFVRMHLFNVRNIVMAKVITLNTLNTLDFFFSEISRPPAGHASMAHASL